MRDDLIFHLATSADWKSFQSAGRYRPSSLEEEGFVPCSYGKQVEEIANRHFKGEEDLLLIVIDLASLQPPVKKEHAGDDDQAYPHVYGPINIDAIIDKIRLEPDEEGTFEINFTSNE